MESRTGNFNIILLKRYCLLILIYYLQIKALSCGMSACHNTGKHAICVCLCARVCVCVCVTSMCMQAASNDAIIWMGLCRHRVTGQLWTNIDSCFRVDSVEMLSRLPSLIALESIDLFCFITACQVKQAFRAKLPEHKSEGMKQSCQKQTVFYSWERKMWNTVHDRRSFAQLNSCGTAF